MWMSQTPPQFTNHNYTTATGDIAHKYKVILSPKRVLNILANPTYTGVISYAGEIYPGKHEPIFAVGPENWTT